MRKTLTIVALVAAVAAVYFVFRPQTKPESTATEADYVAGLSPIVSQAEVLALMLNSEPPGPEMFAAAEKLESDWAETSTAPGYNRVRHDDFIIAFGAFLTRVKSAGMIWKSLNDGDSKPDSRQSLIFTLQSLHGAETAVQLVSRRGLEMDVLLSRTNLAFEVTNSLAQTPEILAGAVKLFNELKSAPATP